MNRSLKVVVLCHCLLNSNAKIRPLAEVPGVYQKPLQELVDQGVGLVQLPCPETCYLGMKRWGMTKNQYETPNYKKFCLDILQPTLMQLDAFHEDGIEIVNVFGMDQSPNCGINITCQGYRGGEISCLMSANAMTQHAENVPGMGVFMEILQAELKNRGIKTVFLSLLSEKED